MYKRGIKRLLDIVLSLTAIIVLLPVYAVIALLVAVWMGRPVLFSQERLGRDGKPFRLYKFRSMTNQRGADGALLPEKDRLTRFGVILRSTSLDELPELFLILRGDMSFIGPRPQPKFYDPYYLPEERDIFKVRGGLIPPDCLSCQPQCSWETQFEYEIYYANHVSFGLDMKILACTFLILVKRLHSHYGADDRPMLNVYRADMVKEEEK